MNPFELELLIKRAFHGVTLDGGCTLVDMEEMGRWGERPTLDEIRSVPRAEFSDNWTVLPAETLDHFHRMAFADAKAMRYYLPAYMVSLLHDCEEFGSIDNDVGWRKIATLSALYPDRSHPGQFEHTISRYALFEDEQRAACALFLHYLPELADLGKGDRKTVERALNNYWRQYLPEGK